MDSDDDPTRALDDFVRRQPPAAPPAAAPDLSDLMQRITPDAPPVSAKPRGGRLRSGERWSADDVVDVPAIDLPPVATPATGPVTVEMPAVAAPAPADVQAIEATVADATRAAADSAAAAPWQPEIDALLQRRALNPRLVTEWQPGCWVGAVREVLSGTTEFVTTTNGPVVETYAPHRLLLAWPPPSPTRPLPARWPDQVRLSAVPPAAAAEVLLAQLPDDARLWLATDTTDIDWALAAEIVLHHDPALRPFQIDGLRAFIAAEREAGFTRLNSSYEQAAAGAAVTRRPG